MNTVLGGHQSIIPARTSPPSLHIYLLFLPNVWFMHVWTHLYPTTGRVPIMDEGLLVGLSNLIL